MSSNTLSTRSATRLAFIVAGFSIAAWAATVPYAKARVGVDEAGLGILLLCLGGGSILAMPPSGGLCARFGSRAVILAGGIGVTLMLPMLALASSPVLLGLALAAFGAWLGALEVAMNIHASEVQNSADKPLMSGFHAMFSVGGFVGAGAPGVVYFYAPGRAGENAETFLTGFDGILQIDGYTGYNRLTKPSRKGGAPILVAHCWAHARRKLKEVFDRDGSEIAAEGLRRIAEFYAVEAHIRGVSPGQRLSARQARTAGGRLRRLASGAAAQNLREIPAGRKADLYP